MRREFVGERLGAQYVETRGIPFAKSYEETGPQTPTFFILSPGKITFSYYESLRPVLLRRREYFPL